MWYLPRVAFVNDSLWFRQPSIGHDIWLTEVSRWADMKNYDTSLAVYAFALSRNQDELPPACDKAVVSGQVEEFLKRLGDCTQEQVAEALAYVQCGITQEAEEYPDFPDSDDEDKREDWGLCISLGTMNKAKAVLWGVTETEAKNMTRQQLEDVIERSYAYHGMECDDAGKYELASYNRTLDKVRERLEAEKAEQKVKNG